MRSQAHGICIAFEIGTKGSALLRERQMRSADDGAALSEGRIMEDGGASLICVVVNYLGVDAACTARFCPRIRFTAALNFARRRNALTKERAPSGALPVAIIIYIRGVFVVTNKPSHANKCIHVCYAVIADGCVSRSARARTSSWSCAGLLC